MEEAFFLYSARHNTRTPQGTTMKHKQRYSIGDVSSICNISKKALRLYDEMGLIPSQRDEGNNYRYYTQQSVLAVPVIKLYKQTGFKLEEILPFVEGAEGHAYPDLLLSLEAKMAELEKNVEEVRRAQRVVRHWHALVAEAQQVMDHAVQDVSVRYVEKMELLFQDQSGDDTEEACIVNRAFTDYAESLNNGLVGPVILRFPSFVQRMQRHAQPMTVLQQALLPLPEHCRFCMGGKMMVSCYHTGGYEGLDRTYAKIQAWAHAKGYILSEHCFERCVADHWTTRDSARFVTEVMLEISRG